MHYALMEILRRKEAAEDDSQADVIKAIYERMTRILSEENCRQEHTVTDASALSRFDRDGSTAHKLIESAYRVSHDLPGYLCGELMSIPIDPIRRARIQNLLWMLLDRVVRLEELVQDVASSGVEFEDPRIRYVTVQIDSETWRSIRNEATDNLTAIKSAERMLDVYTGDRRH